MEAQSAVASRPDHKGLSVAQMVVANRPWRLVSDLSKVLVATLATAGFFIINVNAWSISDDLEAPRLLAVSVLALGGLGGWLIVAHGLWEAPSQDEEPGLTKRVNLATAVTLLLGPGVRLPRPLPDRLSCLGDSRSGRVHGSEPWPLSCV